MPSTETVLVVTADEATIVVGNNQVTVVEQDNLLVLGTTSTGPQGPQGATGPTGPQGTAGVYVSATPPANTALIWVDTTGL